VAHDDNDDVRIYAGDAMGGFTHLRTLVGASSSGPAPDFRGIGVGDVTGDGDPDIVTTSMHMRAHVWPGDGAASFGTQQVWTYGTVDMSTLELARQNDDGALDLVQSFDSTLRVLRSNGGGGFAEQQSWTAPGGFIHEFTSADFDGDGLDDVAYAAEGGLYVALNDGSASFGPAVALSSSAPSALGTGDFDGDGAMDIGEAGAGILFRPGNGSGGFGSPVRIADMGSGKMAVGDLNWDGRDDIVVPNGSAELLVYLSTE